MRPSKQHEQIQEVNHLILNEARIIYRVFSTPEGKQVLQMLKDEYFNVNLAQRPEDTNATMVAIGQHAVVGKLIAAIQLAEMEINNE